MLRRPLARMAVRTTVVAGTAAAVGAHAANKQAATAAPAAEVAPEVAPVAAEPVPSAPGSTAISSDQIQELSQLAALRDSGVLTEAEFETQKAKLLA